MADQAGFSEAPGDFVPLGCKLELINIGSILGIHEGFWKLFYSTGETLKIQCANLETHFFALKAKLDAYNQALCAFHAIYSHFLFKLLPMISQVQTIPNQY